ncbi:EAL domain-containing protein [Asanoa sp. WMMD1127]|uniref:putative bifunctional diguanylate cyclase/phosphodiesterase n=1 Tax=Asanoa sp. WMMD1127 TaxID=3016107 RepID=UPI002417F667|nr:EAL domain-containing protein [Asanoa sp. WMMD1127]MDG4824702.1 EAL domain-containing protein [Asanoa sp. WMMD1127]
MPLLTLGVARLSYLVAIILVAPVLYLFAETRVAGVLLAGVSSVLVVIVRITRAPPRARSGWILIAVAATLMTVGDAIFGVATTGTVEAADFPGRTDLFFLLAYFPLAIGVLRLAGPPAYRSAPTIIDVCLLSLAGSLLIWITVLRPALTSEAESTFSVSVAIASCVGYVAVLAAAIGALASARGRLPVLVIAIGVASFLVANLVFIRARVLDSWGASVAAGFLLLAGVVAAGVAALLPEPEPVQVTRARRTLRPASLVTIAAALLVAPTVLLVEATTGSVNTATAIAAIAIIEAVLVLTRLSIAVAESRRRAARIAVARSGLRRLAFAATEEQILDALRDALDGMLPPGTRSGIHLSPTDQPGVERQLHVLSDKQGELVYPLDTGSTEPGTAPRRIAYVTAPPKDLDDIYASMVSLLDQAGASLARIDLANRLNEKDREQFFQRIVASSEEVILISRDDRIVYVSPSATRMFGRDVRGDRFDDLVRTPTGSRRDWADTGDGDEAVVERPDGTRATALVHRRDLTHDQTIRGVITTLRDVTAERELRRDLEYRATHDPLTGLANAALFRESLRAAGARAVLIIDIDDFKLVNDTYGHQVGDELLTVVAARIAAGIRDIDLAARIGGDEFAVLLRDVDAAGAAGITRRISDTLGRPAALADAMVSTQASIGLAIASAGADADTLLRDADTALYAAKAAGKGRWRQFAPGMPTPSRQRPGIQGRLATALAARRLSLHYEPIVATSSATVAGFEGLPRLDDGGEPMSAAEIARAAEASGLTVELGDWVLARALADLHRLDAPNGRRPFVTVNVAALHLRLPDFADRVQDAIDRSGADPRRLVLEITEAELGEDADRAWNQLGALRDTGVRVAIDDYGTGSASLSHLRQPVIDVIKLDASFIADTASPRSRRLVQAVTDLAAALSLEPVAQGVRDDAARAMLAELGCTYAQGPLFSAPLPVETAAHWSFTDG